MDGEQNGTQTTETNEGSQSQNNSSQQEGGQTQVQQVAAGTSSSTTPDYEKQIYERDEKIAALEAQVAEAAKNAETAEKLRGEIAELKQASDDARVDFKLQLAGCRNVKAARAVLADYDNDIDKLKEKEPWLFNVADAGQGGSGTTGLPNAGAATDEGKQLKRWKEIAGLEDEDKE